MDQALKNKLEAIKLRGTFNGESLETVIEMMLKETRISIDGKRKQIERILGEIKASMAIKDILLRVLDKHLMSEKQSQAEIDREIELQKIKAEEAQKRLESLIEQDGLDSHGQVVTGGVEKDTTRKVNQKENPTKKKKSRRRKS